MGACLLAMSHSKHARCASHTLMCGLSLAACIVPAGQPAASRRKQARCCPNRPTPARLLSWAAPQSSCPSTLPLPVPRHLPGQIVQTGQAVDDLMGTDFLERARFATETIALGGILDRLRLQVGRTSQLAVHCCHLVMRGWVLAVAAVWVTHHLQLPEPVCHSCCSPLSQLQPD